MNPTSPSDEDHIHPQKIPVSRSNMQYNYQFHNHGHEHSERSLFQGVLILLQLLQLPQLLTFTQVPKAILLRY